MNAPSLNHVFNKFAGREVDVVETSQTYKGRVYVDANFGSDTIVIDEIAAEAKKYGLNHVRPFLPGHVGTMDMKDDRLNYHIDKGSDGKYRVVKDSFSIG